MSWFAKWAFFLTFAVSYELGESNNSSITHNMTVASSPRVMATSSPSFVPANAGPVTTSIVATGKMSQTPTMMSVTAFESSSMGNNSGGVNATTTTSMMMNSYSSTVNSGGDGNFVGPCMLNVIMLAFAPLSFYLV